jgi:signal recognition particle subunit SEC65
MARRHGTGETLQSARERVIIKEIQAAVGRELAAQCEVPKTMPQRIADLLRELHRRLRNPRDEAAPRFDLDGAHHEARSRTKFLP